MGTWSIHEFDNDEAADFVDELCRSDNLVIIQSALTDVVSANGYLEVSEAQRGVAAAAVLALLNGYEIPYSADEAINVWLRRQSTKLTPLLLSQAQTAIERVLSENSELQELWADSDEYEAWRNGLLKLQTILGR